MGRGDVRYGVHRLGVAIERRDASAKSVPVAQRPQPVKLRDNGARTKEARAVPYAGVLGAAAQLQRAGVESKGQHPAAVAG